MFGARFLPTSLAQTLPLLFAEGEQMALGNQGSFISDLM
jgi:hypothetical protein